MSCTTTHETGRLGHASVKLSIAKYRAYPFRTNSMSFASRRTAEIGSETQSFGYKVPVKSNEVSKTMFAELSAEYLDLSEAC